MKRVFAVFSALMIVLCATACSGNSGNTDQGGDQTPAVKYEISKVKDLGADVYMDGNGYLVTYDGAAYKFATADGEIIDTAFTDYQPIDQSFVFAKAADSGLWGVVNLKSGEAAAEWGAVCQKRLSNRYVLICYATGAATAESHFGSYTDGQEVYFNGHGRVFDCQLGAFVPNLVFRDSADDVEANMFFIFQRISDSAIKVYTDNGNLADTYYIINVAPDSETFLAVKNVVDDEFLVISKNTLTVGRIFDQINSYTMVNGSNDLLYHYRFRIGKSTLTELTDLHGHPVSDCYGKIETVIDDRFIIATQQDTELWGVDLKGEGNLIPFRFKEIRYVNEGYFQCLSDEGWYLYGTDGKAINDRPFDYAGPLLSSISPDNHTPVLFLNGKVQNCFGSITASSDGLVLIWHSLYSAASGDVLLENVEQFAKKGNRLYVTHTDKTVTIYSIK